MSRIFSSLRQTYSCIILGCLAPHLDRPILLAEFVKQGGPHKPGLTLSEVPSFAPKFQLTVNENEMDEFRHLVSEIFHQDYSDS